MAKFSDELAKWLFERNFRCCFFVSGGNIMHLTESFSKYFKMIPVLHEVSAVIAADYFNEAESENGSKALALVTLGPGVTNTTTGLIGSFLDSREIIVIAGQVKSEDLKKSDQRQRGIQEVDGAELFKKFSKASQRLTSPIGKSEFNSLINISKSNRKGPVFIEICLDVQGAEICTDNSDNHLFESEIQTNLVRDIDYELNSQYIYSEISKSKRPILYVGGGINRKLKNLINSLDDLNIPICTSWNAADRISSNKSYYAGRPNFYGQRFANIFIQNSDLIVIFGSSMGLQSTGFNFKEFAPNAKIIQIDIDPSVLENSNLNLSKSIIGDANLIFQKLVDLLKNCPTNQNKLWINFLEFLKQKLPIVENNLIEPDYVNPFRFINLLTTFYDGKINLIPCSSGGTYTSSMQVINQNINQTIISSKGLGSMGYGLAGSIGACLSNGYKTFLFEGDGGFAQNLQELGVIASNNLNIKIFIFNNNGYASIRATQNKYFKSNLVGTDRTNGVYLPDYELLTRAFGIQYHKIMNEKDVETKVFETLKKDGPAVYEVYINPKLNYLPKIESKLDKNGKMVSQPLHLMSPEIELSINQQIKEFLEKI